MKWMCYNILLMLILASNSPRRQKLLKSGGWKFSVKASEIDESVLAGESPADYVLRLALTKARTVQQNLKYVDDSDVVILAADTTVVDPNGMQNSLSSKSLILGKPENAQEAEAMLQKLRGRIHPVYTGLAAVRLSDGLTLTELVVTEVPMRNYSDEEIREYIASGDPFDKAGAYAIQHAGFHPVQNLQGCYANVMGLPVCHASRLLARLGCPTVSDVSSECQSQLDYPCPVFRQALQIEAPLSGLY